MLTQDQIILLLELKQSKNRKSISMSCNQNLETANELAALGLVMPASFRHGNYSITPEGESALERAKWK